MHYYRLDNNLEPVHLQEDCQSFLFGLETNKLLFILSGEQDRKSFLQYDVSEGKHNLFILFAWLRSFKL